MNHTDPSPAGAPALRLARRPRIQSADTPPGRGSAAASFVADLEALREREANLRAYEERLRVWQGELDARAGAAPEFPAPVAGSSFLRPSSHSPFARDLSLEAAWEKLHRARALLEAEQRQLCDDRLKFRDADAGLRERETDLAAREAQLAERERALAAAATASAATDSGSAAWNLTRAPFRAARAIFRSGD